MRGTERMAKRVGKTIPWRPTGHIKRYYKPHALQQEVHGTGATEKWLEWARRAGKGRTAIGELIIAYQECNRRAQRVVEEYQLVPPGLHSWIVVPTHDQGRQTWHELAALLPPEIVDRTQQEKALIYLKSPGRPDMWGLIEIKSAHNYDALQTVGLDFLWIQEAQDVSNEALDKITPITVQPGRLGLRLNEGIPALWPEHWFWRGCQAAEEGRIEGSAYFHATVYDNPMLTEKQVERIEGFRGVHMTDAAWRRMYLAERSVDAGYFKNIDSCIAGDLLRLPVPGATYVAGLDLGVSRGFTVLLILDADERKVVSHAFWDSVPWPDVKAQVVDRCRSWGVQRLIPDASSLGKGFCMELLNEGLPVEGGTDGLGIALTGEHRSNILNALLIALERETIHFPNIPLLIRQLRAFQYIQNPRTGSWSLGPPAGEQSDEIFALALGLQACNEATPVAPVPRLRSGRYLPTQAETSSGADGSGARLMRDRKTERRRELYEKAGIRL